MKLHVVALLIAPMLCGAPAQKEAEAEASKKALFKGTQIAQAVGTVTSTSVSPLLGVSILGAWEHYHAPEDQRDALPFFTKPWFWIPVSILALLIFFKDTVGSVVPLLKKPLDALEVLFVNKAALLFGAFPVVFFETAKLFNVDKIRDLFTLGSPQILPVVYAAAGTPEPSHGAGMAMLAVMVAFTGLVMSTVVWMVWQAFDVLVLLSPFPLLDVLLKGIRLALFGLLAGLTAWKPEAAAVLSLVIVVVCGFLVAWSWRLLVFGVVNAWDILSIFWFDSPTTPDKAKGVIVFAARRIEGLPKRTYGRLRITTDGKTEFHWRGFLSLTRGNRILPLGAHWMVGRGLLTPSIVEVSEKGSAKTMFRMPPRYRGQEEAVRAVLGLSGVEDLRFRSGVGAFWKWLTDDESPVPVSDAP
jgi:hypothetical protein